MPRPELADTLTALVAGVVTDGPIAVTEVELDVPMEVVLAVRDGTLVVHAAPGHTRFRSGFLPPVHGTRLLIVAEPATPHDAWWPS
jgi:hypothetical protein